MQTEIKSEIILNVTKNIIENSSEIDSEFVDIVNEHFWELV